MRSAEDFHAAEVARLEAEISVQGSRGDAIQEAAHQEAAHHREQLLAQVPHSRGCRGLAVPHGTSHLFFKWLVHLYCWVNVFSGWYFW